MTPVVGDSFVSTDPAATRQYLTERFARHHMSLGRSHPFAARIGLVDLGEAAIADIAYGADVGIGLRPDRPFHLVHASLAGHGTVAARGEVRQLGPNNMLVSSPGSDLEIRRPAQSRHLTVKIGQEALERYAAAFLNLDIRGPVIFHPTGSRQSETPRLWRTLVRQIFDLANASPSAMTAASTRTLYAFTLIDHLLLRHPHNHSDALWRQDETLAPWHVRQAVDRIEAWDAETFSVAALARQVGVSTRTLQLGFRRFKGMSPGEYRRAQQLERLHDLLSRPSREATVTELMLRAGVSDFGRFAARYKQRYGCAPSQTLRRVKATGRRPAKAGPV